MHIKYKQLWNSYTTRHINFSALNEKCRVSLSLILKFCLAIKHE